MEAAGQRDDGPAAERPANQLPGVSHDRGGGKTGNVGEGHGDGLGDTRRQSAESRAEHDGRHGRRRADAATDLLRGHLGGSGAVRRQRHHATALRSVAISACAREISRRRSPYGRKQLSKPLSATRASSSKLKASDCAACTYSSVRVTPLIRRLSVLSTTFRPRSKY